MKKKNKCDKKKNYEIVDDNFKNFKWHPMNYFTQNNQSNLLTILNTFFSAPVWDSSWIRSASQFEHALSVYSDCVSTETFLLNANAKKCLACDYRVCSYWACLLSMFSKHDVSYGLCVVMFLFFFSFFTFIWLMWLEMLCEVWFTLWTFCSIVQRFFKDWL